MQISSMHPKFGNMLESVCYLLHAQMACISLLAWLSVFIYMKKKRLVKCTEYTEWYESDTGADLFPAQTIDSCSL